MMIAAYLIPLVFLFAGHDDAAKIKARIAQLEAELTQLRAELAQIEGKQDLVDLDQKTMTRDNAREFRHGCKVGDIGIWRIAKIVQVSDSKQFVLATVWTTNGAAVNATSRELTVILEQVDGARLVDDQIVNPPGLWKISGTRKVGARTFLVCHPHVVVAPTKP